MNDDSKKGLIMGGAIAAVVVAVIMLIVFMVRSGKANQAGDKPLDATPPPDAQKMMQQMGQRAAQGGRGGGYPPGGYPQGGYPPGGYPGMGR